MSLRNIYAHKDDPAGWMAATSRFDNHVPRFDSKQSCIDFVKANCQAYSNPSEPGMMHSVSTLTSWSQIEQYVFPKVREYNKRFGTTNRSICLNNNRYSGVATTDAASSDSEFPSGIAVHDYLMSRLDLAVHRRITETSTENTLRYLFYHMRCGIFVKIMNNEVVVYCPFVNKDYKNNWGKSTLKFAATAPSPGSESELLSMPHYYDAKKAKGVNDNYLPDVSQWWANGNILCNQHIDHHAADERKISQWWGDRFLLQIKDMIAETCSMRTVPDCEFFVNKRDYPQLKFHCLPPGTDSMDVEASGDEQPSEVAGVAAEPYGFIFDRDDRDPSQDIVLSRHHYASYAPILSFYSSERFADIPFPCTEDWEAATGKVFPATFNWSIDKATKEIAVDNPRDMFTPGNLSKFECSWEERTATAFFRGTATGGGVTADTNQRIKLCLLGYEWEQTYKQEKASSEASGSIFTVPPYLDAKITGWNSRDKKIAGTPVTFINEKDFPLSSKNNFVEMYRQCTYKYLVYVEGHCAACRYGFMMRLGSVILKVESKCVADQMWYFPLLKPYYDHVPVKPDLSDLKEQLKWCRENDDKCKVIASNARALYDRYLSQEAIVDYMQMIFVGIADRTKRTTPWAAEVPAARPVPQRDSQPATRTCCKDGSTCAVCTAVLEAREKNRIQSMQSSKATAISKDEQRAAIRKANQDRVAKRKLAEAQGAQP